jgi:hypothetical protein
MVPELYKKLKDLHQEAKTLLLEKARDANMRGEVEAGLATRTFPHRLFCSTFEEELEFFLEVDDLLYRRK